MRFALLFVSLLLPSLAFSQFEENFDSNIEFASLLAGDNSIQGEYKSNLIHDGKKFYQVAKITLRAINSGDGKLKISANVRAFFGDLNSNEYLSYEFEDCPYNFLTGQISMKSENNDISLIGTLKDGKISGEWFSKTIGKVGSFAAAKSEDLAAPADHVLVQSLTGLYKGTLTNKSQSNLPERLTVSFVTTQVTSGPDAGVKISGNARFYLGEFGSTEYVELKFERVEFNFYNRFLTARTAEYGLTLKGTVGLDGVFKGTIFSDGLGEAADYNVTRVK